jgi:hypothetical protein
MQFTWVPPEIAIHILEYLSTRDVRIFEKNFFLKKRLRKLIFLGLVLVIFVLLRITSL